ncbi:hypothetical protein M0805_009555 [Coniferiporia weirii]|nr:hypothetical protein M0805_009555 [Coniferiporia weirii]
MSAYGAILKPSGAKTLLASSVWKVRAKVSPNEGSDFMFVVMHHLTLATAPPELVSFIHEEFADEIARGDTYPQETEADARYSREAFEGYYFAADVMIGLSASAADLRLWGVDVDSVYEDAGTEVGVDLKMVKGDRVWKDCVAGFYYVKPNYPGRSSHICNAGFVVPFPARGHGFARVLARSYLHYAPRLGYQASVFNLVYVNNAASVHLWESLDFSKAGRIPRAGRLRRKDGQGEEYVDAWVFYKSFES